MNAKRILALFAAVALPVSAQTATPRVDQRQANHGARERARLAKAQDKESRKITRERQDKQRATN